MKRLVVVAALVALASAPIPAQRSVDLAGSSAVPAAPRTVLATVSSWQQRSELLVRLDARTLKRLPGPGLRVRLAPFATAWSPDHRLLALVGQHGPIGPVGADWETAPQLRIVDVAHMQVVRTVGLMQHPRGFAEWLAWLDADHIAVYGSSRLVVVDVRTGHVTRRIVLPATAETIAAGGGRVALLLDQASPGVSPATLLVLDRSGPRQVTLPDVPVGYPVNTGDDRVQHAGLAVTLDGRTAYAMAPGGPVEQVDLDTLAVSAHQPQSGSPSLLGRVARFLQPAAQAKGGNADARCLAVTAAGQLLVTGWKSDVGFNPDDGTYPITTTPAGLTLVDPATWSASLLTADASVVQLAGPVVVGTGIQGVDTNTDTATGLGLHGFRAGAAPFTALAGQAMGFAATVGGLGYAWLPAQDHYAVVDLATGRVLGTAQAPQYASLVGDVQQRSTCP